MASLYDYEINIADLGINVPEWIDQDIDTHQVAAINQGGCASGAYMPAVTYHKAAETMAKYGDDVLDYINEAYGEIPQPRSNESWSGIAVYYLSIAVELWASSIEDEALEACQDRDAD